MGNVDQRSGSGQGMVVSSQPLAVQAGVEMLEAGGTAADAAVATAAVLCVVDPRATGVGGDAFALYWPPGAERPVGLDGAGPAAAAATPAALRAAGHEEMPADGPWTITVPGAVDTWSALLDRYGTLGLGRVLAPAIRIADDGFAVTPVVASEWAAQAHRIQDDEAARAVYLPDGKPPSAGTTFRNPALAQLLRVVSDEGAAGFYRGSVAEQIGAAVRRVGGPLRASDLAHWPGAAWVDPIRGAFRDHVVWEMPPPTQGVVALEALAIFEALRGEGRAEEEHLAVEAIKQAFADAVMHLADPRVVDVPVDRLLGSASVAERARRIGSAAGAVRAPGPATDTVYAAVVDGDGGACSFIQSLYSGFGSGVGVPGLGITLQNRGKGFVLDEGHPNRLAPGKRPYHTIVPAMLERAGAFAGCLGVVGGFMQPQGQMQILRHLIDHDMTPGAALAAPRLRFLGGRQVGAELGYDPQILAELTRRGHEIRELGTFAAGGAQLILRDGSELSGASDPRKDGCVLVAGSPSPPAPSSSPTGTPAS